MKYKLHLMTVGAIVAIMAVFTGFVFAQQPTTTDTIVLSVSPQVFEINANPGDTVTDSFKIVNGTDIDLTLTATPKNFTPEGEEGGVSLTEDTTSYSLASWITVSPNTVVLPARGSQIFDFDIVVPVNAEAGSHLGSVIVQTKAADLDESGVAISQETGPLMLLSISGDVQYGAQIASFTTDSFWEKGPVVFETRITNSGNVHSKPRGTIEIKNMFGKVVTTIDVQEKNVLPDSTRLLLDEWAADGFMVGKYTANLALVYGPDDTIMTSSTSFVVFPYKTIVPITLGVILLVYLAVRYRSRITKAGKALSGK